MFYLIVDVHELKNLYFFNSYEAES